MMNVTAVQSHNPDFRALTHSVTQISTKLNPDSCDLRASFLKIIIIYSDISLNFEMKIIRVLVVTEKFSLRLLNYLLMFPSLLNNNRSTILNEISFSHI